MFNIQKIELPAADHYHYLMENDREDKLQIGETRTNQVNGNLSHCLKSQETGKSLAGASISEADYSRLYNGFDPQTDTPLSNFQRQKFEKGIEYKHTPGWDMNWAPDKSVSAIWALSDDKLRTQIAAAHAQAIDRTMQYIEANLAYTRVGPGANDKEKLVGLLWTRFDHLTSRELDPQLHSHNVLYNMGLRADGRVAAIDPHIIFKNQHLIDGVYMAEFAQPLQKLGFALDHNKHGGFKIEGVPKDLIDGFSKRHLQVKQAIETYGYTHPKGLAKAAKLSRATKKHVPIEHLFRAWKEQGVALGFGPEQATALYKSHVNRFKPRNVAKDISKRLNKSGAEHSFTKIKPKTLNLENLAGYRKSLKTGISKGATTPNKKIGIGKDVGKSAAGLSKAMGAITKAALPLPAAQLLQQAAKTLKTTKKLARTSRDRPQTTIVPDRSKDRDR